MFSRKVYNHTTMYKNFIYFVDNISVVLWASLVFSPVMFGKTLDMKIKILTTGVQTSCEHTFW